MTNTKSLVKIIADIGFKDSCEYMACRANENNERGKQEF